MKPVSPAAAYAALYPTLAEAAREVGYALAVHGSMARDLDLVAIPWTEEAGSPEQLVMRLLSKVGGHLCDGGTRHADGTFTEKRGDEPTAKPHGRMAYTIFFGSGLYGDVSVMPRASSTACAISPKKGEVP